MKNDDKIKTRSAQERAAYQNIRPASRSQNGENREVGKENAPRGSADPRRNVGGQRPPSTRTQGASTTRNAPPHSSQRPPINGNGRAPADQKRGYSDPRRPATERRQPPVDPRRGSGAQGGARPKSKPRIFERIGVFFVAIKGKMTPKVTVISAVGAALLLLSVCILVNILIGVRNIEVTGNDLAGADEIAQTAGVYEGSGYFSYNTRKAEKAVLENIHCISDIKISRSFFGKVKINVTEKTPCWYVSVYGEYYVLSDSLEVIRRSDMRDDFIRRGLVRVDFPEVKSTILGRAVEYADADRDCTYIPDFLKEVYETSLRKEGRINQVIIENKFKISVVCDLKYKINIGKSENASLKLSSVSDAIKELKEDGCHEFNATSVNNISVFRNDELDFSYLKPIYDK